MALTPKAVRSPLHASVTGTAGQTARADFYIWNDPDSEPLSPTLTASKPIPSANTLTVYFDASEYCRDYIAHTTFTPAVVNTVVPVGEYSYLTIKTYLDDILESTSTDLICLDGYGYFAEGHNLTLSPILMDAGTYLVSDAGDVGSISIIDDGVATWTVESRPLNADFPLYTDTLTQTVGQVPYVNLSLRGTGGNRISILKDAVEQKAFTFIEQCEPKYEVFLCDFVNKFGAWQRLTFFKVSKEDFSITSNEYKVMPQSLPYSTDENRTKVFNVNGKESIKVNTGWVDESYSEVIKQLMLSETIRLNDLPVNITSKSSPMKKGINDKNINYEIGFMYSYDTINNIQ